jgi:Second Messenger Oligonucleotide or Dinucleotide Synthetase domain
MAATVAQAFTEFAAKLKPTDAQKDKIEARRTRVENVLIAAHPTDDPMPLVQLRLIGSAGRKTLIRPVDDIDVFAVFDRKAVWSRYKRNSQEFLYRVRATLDEYYSIDTIGSRGQAVRVFYSDGLSIDVTPAFPHYHWFTDEQVGYVIPGGRGEWVQTNPYYHHDFMATRNKALENRLKPLVRLLKRWNRVHSNRMKSFHLEIVAQRVFSRMDAGMSVNVAKFFKDAHRHLHVKDPAGFSGDLASPLTGNREREIKQSFAFAREHAQRAQEADEYGDIPEALRQWRLIFGDEFPGYTAAGRLTLYRPR